MAPGKCCWGQVGAISRCAWWAVPGGRVAVCVGAVVAAWLEWGLGMRQGHWVMVAPFKGGQCMTGLGVRSGGDCVA